MASTLDLVLCRPNDLNFVLNASVDVPFSSCDHSTVNFNLTHSCHNTVVYVASYNFDRADWLWVFLPICVTLISTMYSCNVETILIVLSMHFTPLSLTALPVVSHLLLEIQGPNSTLILYTFSENLNGKLQPGMFMSLSIPQSLTNDISTSVN
jgi:hypothetical protein